MDRHASLEASSGQVNGLLGFPRVKSLLFFNNKNHVSHRSGWEPPNYAESSTTFVYILRFIEFQAYRC